MNIRTVTFDRLTSGEIAAWAAIQRGNPLLGSPYFRPEFTQAVAAVRSDVEVAVLEEVGRPVGFFPYQRSLWNRGTPVGGRLSDFQALIAPQGVSCGPIDLLRACRLRSWHFDHLLGSQHRFTPFVWREESSPYISLADGFEGYARQGNGHRFLPEYRRKKNKLDREVGPVRFVPHVADPAILATLMKWKNDQYSKTNNPRILDVSWIRNLLEKILEFDGESFAPMLSVLYTGDRVAAIALSMRSFGVLHQWFPAYDVEFYRHSPGALLLIETMKSAESLGIRHIDLGKGPEEYKQRSMNGVTRVVEGTADLQPAMMLVRRTWRRTRERLRSSILYGPARKLNRMRNWLAFR